ncbi:uncharacterized protein TRUGW13939_06610 [Talaromyces rugulosus]|uniref:Cutinase n=1 Tax=Talaromyces rugulosus TaxID=121627 RepID=A0A7H8R0C8_TALRU|nr:uncharacterized protein TRUGW13939_06610 [Talaromyces rugulosus]QKX59476.1 hypothetical protein TRUGW13939_06610 [Talaromyces rugulosus]
MRGLFTATIGMLAALATADTTCAPGLYILIARGSGEPAAGTPVPKQGITLPPFTGSIGAVGELVASQLNGTVVAGVDYPATNPLPSTDDNETTIDPSDFKSLNLTDYHSSVNNGTSSIIDEVNQYHKACPDGKIALIGYSQGAQVVMNSLCGGSGDGFNTDEPLSPALVKSNIVSVAIVADPTHIANLTIDRGNSTQDGVFSRQNTTVCQQYDNIIASWCDADDAFCDSGDSIAVHESYLGIYGKEIAEWVGEGYVNATTSQSGSGSNATGTATTTPSTTATATATSTTTSTGAASALVRDGGLLLGMMGLLSVLAL